MVEPQQLVIALAGNPNVGKSTIFNALTGMHQHTGNWPGKTVSGARGRYIYKNTEHLLVDLPGTYSLSQLSRGRGRAELYLLREAGRRSLRCRRDLSFP